MRSFILIGVFIPAAIFCIVVLWPSNDRALTVKDVRTVQRDIYALGRAEGAQREAELGFEIAGVVTKLHVSAGQLVTKGDVLISLDDSLARAHLFLAEAAHAVAQAELADAKAGERKEDIDFFHHQAASAKARVDLAKLKRERASALAGDDVIARQELDELHHQFDEKLAEYRASLSALERRTKGLSLEEIAVFEAKVRQANAKVGVARQNVRKCQIIAPFNGTVVKVEPIVGERVDVHSIEVVICDLSRRRIRAYVEEFDSSGITIGAPARISVDGLPNHSFTGRVAYVQPMIENKRLFGTSPYSRQDVKVREFVVDLDPEKSNQLLTLGMPVHVYLQTESGNKSTTSLVVRD